MSAPSGGGGASGVGAVLGGAGSMLATATTRSFSQAIPFVEAIRLDWDFSRFVAGGIASPLAAAATLDSITLGRGTWHVQCQVSFTNVVLGGGQIVVTMRAPGSVGFVYDLATATNEGPYGNLEAIIALGSTDSVNLINEIAFAAAGARVDVLWLAKRITR